MLNDFVTANRAAIIARARARVAARACPQPSDVELPNGIPIFLDQLSHALLLARSTDLIDHAEIGLSATRHGHDLLRMGLTIGQVVHGYGDVCQAITELTIEQAAVISPGEFRTLNLCLDDAIAGAVSEYARQRELSLAHEGVERLGIFAHELRNALNTATLAFSSIESGKVAPGGSTGLLLGRSLVTLRDLIDRSLAEVRLEAGVSRIDVFPVVELVEELEIGALAQAKAKNLRFSATPVDRTAMVEGDRQILVAALANLLQNAFKFTRKQTEVTLTTTVSADRVRFEVEDACGGLPPGKEGELFLPFSQRGNDRSGLGLGLAICLKAAKASAGRLNVRNLPGKGCIFTLELPRFIPVASVVAPP